MFVDRPIAIGLATATAMVWVGSLTLAWLRRNARNR
jgi:hypothetical protein